MGDRGGGPQWASSNKAGSPSLHRSLHSWKEIATYLGRDERTARRWEKVEGLPVHRLQHNKLDSVFADTAELDAWAVKRTDSGSKRRTAAVPGSRSRRTPLLCLAVLGLLALSIVAMLRVRPARNTALPQVTLPIAAPFTTGSGTECEPELSPDGKQVAYVWNGESRNNFDIYVRSVSGGPPFRLTDSPEADYGPAWSPDGRSVAFLRQLEPNRALLLIVPAPGGAERLVTRLQTAPRQAWSQPGPFLSWSPDGAWIVAAARNGSDYDRLLRISAVSGESQTLTEPPLHAPGDTGPSISPDGKMVAFSRRLSWSRSDLCLLPVAPGLVPADEVRCLHTGSDWNSSPAWTPDGARIVFSTGRMDSPHLASIEIAGAGPARRLAGYGEYGWQPSVVRVAGRRTRLVYTRHFESVNIWRVSLDRVAAPEQLIASAHWSYEPSYSPDGNRIAFISDRSGNYEIWVAGADGTGARQWTFLKRPSLGCPRWSPDGKRIAFTAPVEEGSSVHIVDGPGATPRRVSGSELCGYLDWSLDGMWIFFSSNRGPSTEIWKVPAEGGEAVPVTHTGGRVPAASLDGKSLFYLRIATPAGDQKLWRMPLDGGKEEKVLDFVDAYSVGATGIAIKYYRPGPGADGPYLELFRFGTGRMQRPSLTTKPLRYGIALSRDGRSLLFSQADYEASELMLVEGVL